MTGTCCNKRVMIAGVVLALFAWAFDFIIHGALLMNLYLATAEMWRPMDQMQSLMPWCLAYHLFMGLAFAGGYYCWRKHITTGALFTRECPYRKSMKFGLWVGALLGGSQLMAYVWLPFETIALPAAWAISELVKWTLAGMIMNKLYKPA